MKFKNYRKHLVRFTTKNGGAVRFVGYEERELPEHLTEAALAAGLVPLEEVEDIEQREARIEAERAEDEARAKAEAQAAEEARATALKEAAEKAAAEVAEKAAAKPARKPSPKKTTKAVD